MFKNKKSLFFFFPFYAQQTGGSEQFEQVVFLAWPMRLSLWLYTLMNSVFGWCGLRQTVQPQKIKWKKKYLMESSKKIRM